MTSSAISNAERITANLMLTPPEALCQIITPCGMLGYGLSETFTIAALDQLAHKIIPTALILDSGSTDSGPSKLALGSMTCPRSAYERDLRKLLQLGVQYKVPLLISSAGGDGSDEHVNVMIDIIREIAAEFEHRSWNLKVLAIYSGIPKSLVLERLENGQTEGCGPSVPALTVDDINKTPRIVGQMGPEPFLQAMIANPDFNVIVGGRAYDPSPYVAFCSYHALQKNSTNIFSLSSTELGAFYHMGKIMECGGLCAIPKGLGAIAIVNKDSSFDIEPLDPAARCTPLSIAAHSLYEKARPDILHGPGGYLDLIGAEYQQLPNMISVRAKGSQFYSSRATGSFYTVKLEGAKVSGYRTLVIGSFRDPILIPQINSFLDRVKAYAYEQHRHVQEKYAIGFHVYGASKDLPMNDSVSEPSLASSEVFVVCEIIADSQAVATSLASSARIACAHGPYPGQKATSGNFAMGIGGKLEIEMAECTEFSIYHLMYLKDGEEGGVLEMVQNEELNGNQNVLEASILSDKPKSKHSAAERGLFRWTLFSIGTGACGTSQGGDNGPDENPPTSVPRSESAKKGTHLAMKPTVDTLSKRLRTLVDVASVVRSKNAGPFEITFDVMFDSLKIYEAVKGSGILSAEVIARLFDTTAEEIVWCGFFDVALAFKATIPRKRNGRGVCSGGYMEDDVHGSQRYIPLAELPLTEDLIRDLQALKKN